MTPHSRQPWREPAAEFSDVVTEPYVDADARTIDNPVFREEWLATQRRLSADMADAYNEDHLTAYDEEDPSAVMDDDFARAENVRKARQISEANTDIALPLSQPPWLKQGAARAAKVAHEWIDRVTREAEIEHRNRLSGVSPRKPRAAAPRAAEAPAPSPTALYRESVLALVNGSLNVPQPPAAVKHAAACPDGDQTLTLFNRDHDPMLQRDRGVATATSASARSVGSPCRPVASRRAVADEEWYANSCRVHQRRDPSGRLAPSVALPQRHVPGLPPPPPPPPPPLLPGLAPDSKFHTFGALLHSVATGAIRPLRGSYVVMLWRAGELLPKRQDLPPEAFFDADELEARLRACRIQSPSRGAHSSQCIRRTAHH